MVHRTTRNVKGTGTVSSVFAHARPLGGKPRAVAAAALGFVLSATSLDACRTAPEAPPAPSLRPVWTQAGDGVPFGSPAVAETGAFATDAAGTLWALDAGTGAVQWTAALGGDTAGAPVVDAGQVIVVTLAGDVEAFDRPTGAPRWAVPLGGAVMAGLARWGAGLFAVTGAGVVTGLDAAAGAVLWTRDLGGIVAFTPGVADAALLVPTFDGRLSRLDLATGAVLWESVPDPTYVIGTPLVAGARVVVPGYEDTLLGLSLDDGSTAWSRYAGNYLVALPVVRDGVAYFGSAQGPIVATGAVDGQALWTLPDVLYGRQALLFPTAGDLLVLDLGGPWTWIDRAGGTRSATGDLGFEVNGAALLEAASMLVVSGGGALHGLALDPGPPAGGD